jgi:MFS family permease
MARVELSRTQAAFLALAHRDFRLFQLARLGSSVAAQIQAVAVGWEMYALTGSALDLGFVGLAVFVPALLLSPWTGQAADHLNRRQLLLFTNTVLLGAACLLVHLSATRSATPAALYAVLACVGAARAFQGPAAQALMPSLVPREVFPNAVAWGSSVWQVSVVAGPALGGLVYGRWGAAAAFATSAALEVLTVLVLAVMRGGAPPRDADGARVSKDLVAGLRFVRSRPVILGAISLDLFGVLFGGAVALLPVYARDILHAGPETLGALRSAPAIGALAVALWLAYHPIERRAGPLMLASVVVFGLATIAFGLSRSVLVSIAALALTGAADMVSVFIRHSVVQLRTPDAMRGRVSAVNMVFIGASNELGEFESGVAAEWLGPVTAVSLGGALTCLVVLIWAFLFPELRRIDELARAD